MVLACLTLLRYSVLPSCQLQVVPKESSHFGVYSAAAARMLLMEETTLYQQDRIGLRALNDSGRLVRETVPGRHMQFSLAWFRREVVHRWLAVPVDGSSL